MNHVLLFYLLFYLLCKRSLSQASQSLTWNMAMEVVLCSVFAFAGLAFHVSLLAVENSRGVGELSECWTRRATKNIRRQREAWTGGDGMSPVVTTGRPES